MRHSRRFCPSGKDEVVGARVMVRVLAQEGQTVGKGGSRVSEGVKVGGEWLGRKGGGGSTEEHLDWYGAVC